MDDKVRCAKCGSDQVIPEVRIPDYHSQLGDKSDLAVELYRSPDALVFKGKHRGKLIASACGNCGYVELFVENPQQLWSIYQRSL